MKLVLQVKSNKGNNTLKQTPCRKSCKNCDLHVTKEFSDVAFLKSQNYTLHSLLYNFVIPIVSLCVCILYYESNVASNFKSSIGNLNIFSFQWYATLKRPVSMCAYALRVRVREKMDSYSSSLTVSMCA